MSIFTTESLQGVAWIVAGLWAAVKLIEMVVERWDTLTSYSRDLESLYRRVREANETIESLELENAMMKKHFFPDVEEVMTTHEDPVRAQPKRGRPRKK
jgi:hypothetical protein